MASAPPVPPNTPHRPCGRCEYRLVAALPRYAPDRVLAQGQAGGNIKVNTAAGHDYRNLDTLVFDLTGNPSMTLPGGQTAEGAPIAFQLVVAHFAEQYPFQV